MIGQAQDIIRDAQVALQDIDGTRWSAVDLARYLRDGLIMLLQVNPWERSTSASFTPAVGPRQELPSDAMRLLEVECNEGGRKRAMTRIERHDLQAVARDWLSMRPATELIHWMVSQNEPRLFHVYPPAAADARLELTYCQYPPSISAAGPTWSSVSGDTGVEAKWSPALLDYVLYRAWLRDGEYAGNGQMAGSYLTTFMAAIGAQAQQPTPSTT